MDITKVTVTYSDGSVKDFETVDALVAEHAPTATETDPAAPEGTPADPAAE